jgi:hypothetical protein
MVFHSFSLTSDHVGPQRSSPNGRPKFRQSAVKPEGDQGNVGLTWMKEILQLMSFKGELVKHCFTCFNMINCFKKSMEH